MPHGHRQGHIEYDKTITNNMFHKHRKIIAEWTTPITNNNNNNVLCVCVCAHATLSALTLAIAMPRTETIADNRTPKSNTNITLKVLHANGTKREEEKKKVQGISQRKLCAHISFCIAILSSSTQTHTKVDLVEVIRRRHETERAQTDKIFAWHLNGMERDRSHTNRTEEYKKEKKNKSQIQLATKEKII